MCRDDTTLNGRTENALCGYAAIMVIIMVVIMICMKCATRHSQKLLHKYHMNHGPGTRLVQRWQNLESGFASAIFSPESNDIRESSCKMQRVREGPVIAGG